ncbi:hypothetical protein HT746_05750 [Burkholderia pyrrocinia]|uniref:hypothetical protein n=1 Tax=Burkholderia pyrrocinia TaxID=60550 RepID=UPI001575611A|nr:hypothetical protein [Burkholderia pyrrocinia]NTX26647.1 hypothetical protein [Burkholderia pyrrocinia]QVN23405.1 hypothetical protein JYG32_33530 [Burkholderia pyrrocinia]
MNDINELIDVLALCVPQLDPAPLRAELPASTEQDDVLDWFADHLEAQQLLVYEEWKEYFGHVPELRPLSGIDLSQFDDGFVVGLVSDIDWESVDPMVVDSVPYELPYLEYINSALHPHGLRLVDLLPFENAYIFCVKDDDAQLDRLRECLKKFDMDIVDRRALDREGAKARLDAILAA